MRQGILVLADNEAFARLRAFATGGHPQLLDPRDMFQLHDKVGSLQPNRVIDDPKYRQVVRQGFGNPRLVPRGEVANFGGLLRPSINTTGREAFAWLIGPHLAWKERQALQGFWDHLPPFDPNMPNYDPQNYGNPATPSKTEDGKWDWTNALQPIRWFFCPCCIRKHECVYTGSHPMQCRGWRGVCCRLVSPVYLMMQDQLLISI